GPSASSASLRSPTWASRSMPFGSRPLPAPLPMPGCGQVTCSSASMEPRSGRPTTSVLPCGSDTPSPASVGSTSNPPATPSRSALSLKIEYRLFRRFALPSGQSEDSYKGQRHEQREVCQRPDGVTAELVSAVQQDDMRREGQGDRHPERLLLGEHRPHSTSER